MFDDVLSQPQMPYFEATSNIAGGILEIGGGLSMMGIGYGTTLSPTAPASAFVGFVGTLMTVKGIHDVTSGYNDWNDLLSGEYGSKVSQSTAYRAYNIVDGGFSAYDNSIRLTQLSPMGMGSMIVSAMRLYVNTFDYFFGK